MINRLYSAKRLHWSLNLKTPEEVHRPVAKTEQMIFSGQDTFANESSISVCFFTLGVAIQISLSQFANPAG
jgi:hypothetical protein